jgi:2-iminobutanoate/2-iminopropanoate deaminase
MTQRQAVSTSDAPTPGGSYSQAIIVGDLVYTAGMGPHDPRTGEVVGDDIATQTAQVLRNLSAVLAAAGSSLADVVKATTHLQHLERDFAGYDRVYRDTMSEPYPVRTTVGSALYGMLVEIDVVAVRRQ